MRKTILVAIALFMVIAHLNSAQAAVIYSTTGSTYSQDFDTLPLAPENTSLEAATPAKKWIDDTAAPTANQISLQGWYLYYPLAPAEGGTNAHQRFRISAGQATTGSFYSFGSTSSTDRALGDVGSTTIAPNPTAPATGTPIYIGLQLNNGTSNTLGSFTLQYTGEEWRHGGGTIEKISVGYTTAASTNTTNWADQSAVNPDFTAVPALTFSSPNTATADQQLNGNLAGNRTTLSATVTGLSWAPGTDLWIRFNEPQVAGNDDSLGIDDLTFSADVPEPSCLMLLGAFLAGLGLSKRRFLG